MNPVRYAIREFVVLPLALWLMVAPAVALAQSTGTFAPTGSMTTSRYDHTATLLPNGMVLIAGGVPINFPDADVLASAELYDPATGNFTATGSMTTGRAQHTATLLPDGRVLMAGGTESLTAEIYDLSAAVFARTGDMVAKTYSGPFAALLRSGKVLVAGYPTAQIFDPATGNFFATSPYAAAAPSVLESVTLLADGRVLLTGAINICYEALCANPGAQWAEIYDPLADHFSIAVGMQWWNDVYNASLLTSGEILLEGNGPGGGIQAEAQVFDPSDETFRTVASPLTSHGNGAATLLPDGTVLVTGGGVLSELYVQANAAFSAAGNMIKAREAHTATLLRDGTVLIAGGFGPDVGSSAELYKPAALVQAPVLFSLSGNGEGQGAIWHAASGAVASPGNPAAAGEILSMYTTSLTDGSVIPPLVAVGGHLSEILFFGSAPGYRGYYQVNFRVPDGIAPGAAPVRLTYLGRPSNEVGIGVQ